MTTVVVTIPNEEETAPKQNKKSQFAVLPGVSSLVAKYDARRIIHSVKVGVALVLVSLLYLLDPVYKQVGENAMWAIMTVVVIFEFTAGATISKGLNRGIGTVLGGGLGCLAAILADVVGGVGNVVVIGTCVFVFGAAATYFRHVPTIKRRYEYGAMIFILTFNLVVVSGLRADKIMNLARERLSTIGMGFAICIFISLLLFPIWASDELHNSLASKFEKLASCVEGCLEGHFKPVDEKGSQCTAQVDSCKSLLYSKTNEESLANFARWEPWHGRFGIFYPWDKYIEIGNVLRELATIIIALEVCLQSSLQPSSALRRSIQEPCEAVGSLLGGILRELGESIMKMERCRSKALITSTLQSMTLALSGTSSPSKLEGDDHGALAAASSLFLMMEMVKKVELLAKKVEELGEVAGFQTK